MVAYFFTLGNSLFEKIGPNIKNQAVNLQTNKVTVLQRINIILVVLLMLNGKLFSQQYLTHSSQLIYKAGNRIPILNNNTYHDQRSFRAIRVKKNYVTGENRVILKNQFIRNNHYHSQLGFFCKREIQLEKITTVPIRFRLGSLDYVNWLEGKR